MTKNEVRGYVVALSLAGFSTAWAAAAHDTTSPVEQDPAVLEKLRAQSAMLAEREAQVAERTRDVNAIIAKRRADAKKPRPVRYVRVYVRSGGSTGAASSGSSGGGRSSTSGGGGGGSVAPVSVAPVTSSGSS